jgi:hypothetical protein
MSAPNSTAVASAIFQGYSQRQLDMAIAYLLQQIAGNTMTPNQLAVASNCFNCFDERMLAVVQTYLLNQISSGGGTGSGGLYQGAGSPVGVFLPANKNVTNHYTDTVTGILYYWNIANQDWE